MGCYVTELTDGTKITVCGENANFESVLNVDKKVNGR